MPPIEHIVDMLLWTVLPPAALAAALMAAACAAAKRHDAVAAVGSAVAIAAGLILGSRIDDRLPWIPVPESLQRPGWQWLLVTAMVALAIDGLVRLPRVPAGLGWALRGMVAAQAGLLLTPAGMRAEFFWAPFLVGATVLSEWALLEQLGRVDLRGLIPLALAPVAVACSLVLIFAASGRFGQVAMVVMAVLVGVGIVALIMGRETNGVAAAVAVLLPGLLLSGQYDSSDEVPAKCFALAALSPLALAPSLLPAWRRLQKKGLWAVQWLLLLLPVAWALFLAAQTGSLNFEETPEDNAGLISGRTCSTGRVTQSPHIC